MACSVFVSPPLGALDMVSVSTSTSLGSWGSNYSAQSDSSPVLPSQDPDTDLLSQLSKSVVAVECQPKHAIWSSYPQQHPVLRDEWQLK